MRSVYTKTLRDKRWFTTGWSIGFLALAGLMVSFYPAMHVDGSLDALLKNMPAALQGFVGDLGNLKHFSTYLASQMFDVSGQILGGVMVIIVALSLTVAEEDAGQTRTLLSLPISRTSLLLQKWLAMATIIGIVVSAMGVGVLLFQPLINEAINLAELIRLLVMTWLLLVALGTVTFAAAMATGKRSVAMLVGILVVVGSFILTTFATGVEWLQDYEMWSVFYYYPAVEIVTDGIKLSDVAVLGTLAVVPLVVSLLLFRHRDIN